MHDLSLGSAEIELLNPAKPDRESATTVDFIRIGGDDKMAAPFATG